MNLRARFRQIAPGVAWGTVSVLWLAGITAPFIALASTHGSHASVSPVVVVFADLAFSAGLIVAGSRLPRLTDHERAILRRGGIGLIACLVIQALAVVAAIVIAGVTVIFFAVFGTLFIVPGWILKDDPPQAPPGDEGGEPVAPLPPGYRKPTGPHARFSRRPPRRPSDAARPPRIRRLLPVPLGG
jgi:hypothetical protein